MLAKDPIILKAKLQWTERTKRTLPTKRTNVRYVCFVRYVG